MSYFALAAVIAVTSCFGVSESLKVIAGDTIDFQCVTEKGDSPNVEYLPNFERRNDDG